MKTLLLLAGQSKRFWPLRDKPLFPIVGKTLLEHQVQRLQAAGATDIVLVGGKHNLIQAAALFPDLKTVEQEKLELGMRGALLSALPDLNSEPVLIVSANDVIDQSGYRTVMTEASKPHVDGALLSQKVTRYFPGGYLVLEGERITGIVEKPGEGNEPSDLVNIVAHVHRDASVLLQALSSVDESGDDGYEQALATMFAKYTYHAAPHTGVWQAVKYPWHLLHLLPVLLEEIREPRIHSTASVHPSAILEGAIVLGEGVRVLPNAVLIGPCIIGAHTIIGNNALVRASSINDHCVIGYNTEVKGSVLCDHVWTHSTYIGESVIGANVSFGAGCVTGNLRLDEQEIASLHNDERFLTGLTKFGTIIGSNCRLGIHCGINPGIKIGGETFVSSGMLVDRDIPDGQFVSMKEGQLHLRPNIRSVPHPAARNNYRSRL